MFRRICNDYFMRSRLKNYEMFLKKFLENKYKYICLKDYNNISDEKYIIIRHDIDSDVAIAKKMFQIEKKLNIKSTYYFRLSTIDKDFIQEIVNFGSEVGYHYEEIAQYCKDQKEISKEFVEKNFEKIQKKFKQNIEEFEKNNNLKLYSIASHGDWVNRKIDISNKEIYKESLKKELGLIEAYEIENILDFRTADSMYPKFWKNEIDDAIINNSKKVLLLVHPRWWDKSPKERFFFDLNRILEKIKYQ